jgi:hypothetical protein
MSVTRVRKGDKRPVSWLLTDVATKGPLDLTGATIVIEATPKAGAVIPLTATAAAPATAGRVTHMLSGDLAEGMYSLEFKITSAGQQITAPTTGAETLVVEPLNRRPADG